MTETEEPPRRRGVDVVVAAAVAIGAVGLILGVEGTSNEVVPKPVASPYPTPSQGARSYRDMQVRDYGVNRGLPATWFANITQRPDPTTVVVPTAADREAALVKRATNRAYDGAPPTIPHPVDQDAAPACLACHEHGARIGQRIAPAMSHARHDSCLQCHVVGNDPRPTTTTPPAPDTMFVGARPVVGARAWTGAPPTIPHATTMRSRCDSCHGPTGALGIRPNHPWRVSCQQCHAPSAVLDQRAPGASP